MEITFKFRGAKTVKRSKIKPGNLFSNISYGYTNAVSRGYWIKDYVIAMHYEKRRKKLVSTKRIKKEFNGQTVWTNKRQYEPAKWIITYYKIPYEILRLANLKVVQKERHFEIKSVK